jgi:hypothetical protein
LAYFQTTAKVYPTPKLRTGVTYQGITEPGFES